MGLLEVAEVKRDVHRSKSNFTICCVARDDYEQVVIQNDALFTWVET
jgi:hypothetical protein